MLTRGSIANVIDKVEELIETPSSLSGSNEASTWNEGALQAVASLKDMVNYLEVYFKEIEILLVENCC